MAAKKTNKKMATKGAGSGPRRDESVHDLNELNPEAFEHLANALALRVLGPGLTFFCQGPDGGRDAFFQGSAPYPSATTHWSGTWFIQSKFHARGLTNDAQKWLRARIADEIKAFKDPESGREWPENWIIVSNVDPSGTPGTGTFDAAREMVRKARPGLVPHFHIWGAKKVLEFLSLHPDVANRYAHFLTSGHVLAQLRDNLTDDRASVELILKTLLSDKLVEQQATRLEEAGSETDSRPPIHRVFVDLPFRSPETRIEGLVCSLLRSALMENHSGAKAEPPGDEWVKWNAHPVRAPVWFVKGGPGHGKSTVGQFVAQVQRCHSPPSWSHQSSG